MAVLPECSQGKCSCMLLTPCPYFCSQGSTSWSQLLHARSSKLQLGVAALVAAALRLTSRMDETKTPSLQPHLGLIGHAKMPSSAARAQLVKAKRGDFCQTEAEMDVEMRRAGHVH